MDNNQRKDLMTGLKISLLILAIIFVYLFLLNGRYADISGGYCFDKWKGKMIEIEYAN